MHFVISGHCTLAILILAIVTVNEDILQELVQHNPNAFQQFQSLIFQGRVKYTDDVIAAFNRGVNLHTLGISTYGLTEIGLHALCYDVNKQTRLRMLDLGGERNFTFQ